jgi:hypothetical protein
MRLLLRFQRGSCSSSASNPESEEDEDDPSPFTSYSVSSSVVRLEGLLPDSVDAASFSSEEEEDWGGTTDGGEGGGGGGFAEPTLLLRLRLRRDSKGRKEYQVRMVRF